MISRFYFETFQKYFCTSVSFFALRFIELFESFNSSFKKLYEKKSIEESMVYNFQTLKKKIEGLIYYFNKNFHQFLFKLFENTINESEDNFEFSENGMKLKENFIRKKAFFFNKFYFDLFKETIDLIKPEYIKFVTQLSPYFNSLNFEWIEKYKYLASLDTNLIKSYH